MSDAALPSNVLPYRRQSFALPSRMNNAWEHDSHAGVDFRALFESVWTNSSDALRVSDSKGVIIAVNSTYCRLVGMQTEELVGKPFTVVYDSSVDPSEHLAKYCARFNEGKILPVMNRQLRLHNGKEIYAEASNSYIKGSDGSTFVLSVIRDVSERHAAEEALKNSERKYHELVNNAVQGIFQSSVDGRLLTANNALLKMLGYDSFDELASRNLAEVYVNPDKREALSMMLVEKGACSDIKLTLKRKDGSVITVLEHSRAVRDESGNVVSFEGILEDISERTLAEEASKRTEEALHQERNQLRLLIDNLPDLVYFKDAQGRYVLNNRAHLRSIGAEHQANALGKTTFDFHLPEFAEKYHEDEAKIIRTGESLLGKEEHAVHKDTGELRWHLTSKIPLVNAEGTITGIVGISRDITEQKELEMRVQDSLKALQASRESLAQLNTQKDRLFSVLSHDLRSPFTSILGFCEILLTDGETLTDAERSEFLTYIRDAAQRQLSLLNKLLDWSRLETGRIKLNIEEVTLDAVALNSVKTHQGTAKQKGITLRSTLPGGMKMRGDEDLLMQLLNNLISNALKFTPRGGMVSIDLTEQKDQEWVLAIKDTGMGIPKEDLKRLFRVEEKYTRPGLDGEQGTGLGLSLVNQIVKQHNGSIAVESVVGQGTTFTMRFPRLVENRENVVMVVDDDEGIRVLHSRHLKRMYPDVHVITASNGKEAFALAKQCRPRLVVTDYSMPEMNGCELLNLLKNEPTTKHIPVFVITGKGSTASKETLLLNGAVAVLDKPVPRKELQETIEKALAEKI